QVPEPCKIDDQPLDARARQSLHVTFDERLFTDAKQRFRDRVGERAHSLAASGGEDHRRAGAFRGATQVMTFDCEAVKTGSMRVAMNRANSAVSGYCAAAALV